MVDSTLSSPCTAYNLMLPDWQMTEALMAGTRAMRIKGETYLPQFQAETAANYSRRKAITFLSNYFKRTVRSYVGKPFSKPIRLMEDVSDEIKSWAEDVDLQGNHLHVFARNLFESGLVYGLAHVLIDYPPLPAEGEVTVAEEREQNRRPYWILIPAKNLISWRSELRMGRQVLTQVRIYEKKTVADGEWDEKEVERIRVLELGSWRLYELNGDWILKDSGPMTDATGQPLTEIPLVTFYTDQTGFMTGRSPLLDLAWLNIRHWQSSSDQNNILQVSRFPMLGRRPAQWESNPDENGIQQVGPQTQLIGDFYFVEPTGAAIAAGRADLEGLEREMDAFGQALLTPQSGSETATGRAIAAAEANSALQNMALGLADTLENALKWTAKWAGLEIKAAGTEHGGSVEVYTGFGQYFTAAEDVKSILAMLQMGTISRRTALEEIKRRGLLGDEFDFEEEETRLIAEGLTLRQQPEE